MKIGPFRIGMRTIKTGLAVALCILIFALFKRGAPTIAALSAVFALRTDVEKSVHFGKDRVLGNTVGGVIALIYILIFRFFGDSFVLEIVGVPLAIILLIVICDAFNTNDGIVGASACCLLIIFSISPDESLFYVVARVFDTFIGTFVAIGVNFLIPTPIPEKKEEITHIKQELAELEDETTNN